ncbi:MAG: pilus assembly protein PilM [Deltaproteobacteria bacterium]|nr:pilus assembly protein PilM [Deltaproteobacteria bacterium]MDL1961169.1 pilus assembly protein PilM [Deltaproteobacteria bacterium]
MKFPSLPKKWGQRQRPTLGLDIGSHSIKIVELSSNGTSRTIRCIGRALVPPQAIVDGSIKELDKVTEVLKILLGNLRPKVKYAATSIAGYSVIVKKIIVPYQDEGEIERNLIFEAEKYVPFEIEEVYVDFHVLDRKRKESSGTEIFLVAAKREIVDEYAVLIQEVGLSPAVVDVDAFALGNALEGAFGLLTEPIVLVDIGAQKTNVNIILQGASLFARDMAFGGAQLTEAIQEATGLEYLDAERIKIAGSEDMAIMKEVTPVCKELCGVWAEELKKAMDFYKANSSTEGYPTQLYASGGSASLKGLDRLFDDIIGLPVKIFNPLHGFTIDHDIEPEYISSVAPQMAIATGLALRTLTK